MAEVVTVPDDVDDVLAVSPMTDAGSEGTGYFRPTVAEGRAPSAGYAVMPLASGSWSLT